MIEKPLQIRLEKVGQHPDQYTLHFDDFQFPITVNLEAVTFSDWLRRLQTVLVGKNDPSGELTYEALLRNIGIWLWQRLLPENIPTLHRETLAQALRTGSTPLLLSLPTLLATLPWELLYDPEQSTDRGFLASCRSLIRLSTSTIALAPIEPPLRVLLLISSPLSLDENSRVDVESERTAIEQATRKAREEGKIHMFVEDIITLPRVEAALDHFQPHIVHYIGHGIYNETTGGALLWEDEQGNELVISDKRLAEVFSHRNIHAVILHGCETGRSNTRMDVHGLAGTLANTGIPSILAQQASFTYLSSLYTSKTWYTELTAGQSFAEALLTVRQVLIKADRPDWAVPILQGSVDSLTPVLTSASLPGPVDPLLINPNRTDIPTPIGVFVGRHRELRALCLMLENTQGNGPTMALITGPAGIGKSALAALAVRRYGRAYKAALTLHCQGTYSIDLFLQQIGKLLKQLENPGFLEYTLPDPKLSMEAKIEEATAALNLAGPVLLVIDNLESVQNSDHTINDEALHFLLQHLPTSLQNGRVLVCGRYMVKDLFPDTNQAAQANILHLEPGDLSTYETSQLLRHHPILSQLSELVQEKLILEFGGLPSMYDLLSSKAAAGDLERILYEVRKYGTEEQTHPTKEQARREEWQKIHARAIEFATLQIIVDQLSKASRILLAQLGLLSMPFPLAAIEQGLESPQTVWQPLLDWSLLHYDPQQQMYQLQNVAKRYTENEDLLTEQARTQTQARLALWYESYALQHSYELADYLEAYRLFRTAGNVQQAGLLIVELAEILKRFGLHPLLWDLCVTTLTDIGESETTLAANLLEELGMIAHIQGEYTAAQKFFLQSLMIFEKLEDHNGQAELLHQLGMIFQYRGEYADARKIYQQSLEIKEQFNNQRGRVASLHQLANIAHSLGEYNDARRIYEQNVHIYEQLDDHLGRAASLYQLGMIAQDQGEYMDALDFSQQSLAIFEQLGDQHGRANSFCQMGNISYLQGEYEKARLLFLQSLDIFEQVGNPKGRISILHQLGLIAENQGEYEEARRLYQQSLDGSKRQGDQKGQAQSLHQLGSLAQDQGNYAEAQLLYQQSLTISEQFGDQHGLSAIRHQLGTLAQDQGEYEKALSLYQQNLEAFERMGDQSGKASSLSQLGSIAEAMGEYEEAHRFYQQSLEIQEKLGDQDGRATSLGQLGIIAYRQGMNDKAHDLYQQSLALFELLGNQSGQASCLHQLGMLAQQQGKSEDAQLLYQTSLEIFKRLKDLKGQATSLHQLGNIAYFQENYVEAQRLSQTALDIFERLGNPPEYANTLIQMGSIALIQGEVTKAQRLCQQGLAIKEQFGDQRGCLQVLLLLGTIAQDQEDYAEARRLYQQALSLCEQSGDQHTHLQILYQLGIMARNQENYTEARHFYQQALTICEQSDDQHTNLEILRLLGTMAQDQSDYTEARRLYQQSLTLCEQLDDQYERLQILHLLGTIAQDQGDYTEARRLYQQNLTLCEQLDALNGQANALYGLGMIAQNQGQYTEARRFYQQSLNIAKQTEDQDGQATISHALGMIAQAQGAYEEADNLYQQGLTIFEHLENQQARANTLHQLGTLAQDQEKYEEARLLYQQSLAIKDRLGDQHGRASSLHQLAMLAQEKEEYTEAQRLYQQSLAIFELLRDQQARASSLHQLGMLAQELGKDEEAEHLYQQSLSIVNQLGDQHGQANSLLQLGSLSFKQQNFEKALHYTLQSYILFTALQSPSITLARDRITALKSYVDTETLMGHWSALAGDLPFPLLAPEHTEQLLLQVVIDFLNAPTWVISKKILNAHPELLQPEADTLLQNIALQAEQEEQRKTIEEHRVLLTLCKYRGIDAAFNEQIGRELLRRIVRRLPGWKRKKKQHD